MISDRPISLIKGTGVCANRKNSRWWVGLNEHRVCARVDALNLATHAHVHFLKPSVNGGRTKKSQFENFNQFLQSKKNQLELFCSPVITIQVGCCDITNT